MSGCMEAPDGSTVINRCPECDAVSAFYPPGRRPEGDPAMLRDRPPEDCLCRCHDVWRLFHGVPVKRLKAVG